jgi:hypothetical protein
MRQRLMANPLPRATKAQKYLEGRKAGRKAGRQVSEGRQEGRQADRMEG